MSLSVRGLTLRQGAGLCVEDVSFTAPARAVTAILGGPEAGKTTLLAGIAGLIRPERGAVLVSGTDVTALRAGARDIGLLPPGTDLAGGGGTLGAALRRVAGRSGGAASEAVDASLGLARAMDLRLEAATHGQGFLALACARLLPRGGVLLVDEAGIGLDGTGQDLLLDWLRREAEGGRTILLATRERRIGLAADHLVLLDHGRVVQAGAPASVYAEPRNGLAALALGPANLLSGMLRQKVPGGFIWMAEGLRFMQADTPGHPTPTLGTAVALCLRPDSIVVSAVGEGENRLPAVITRLVCVGARTELWCDTALGPVCVAIPGPPALRAGMEVILGWTRTAAVLMTGDARVFA